MNASISKRVSLPIITGQQIRDWDDLEVPISDAELASGVLVDLFEHAQRNKWENQGDILLSKDCSDRISFMIYDVQRRVQEIETAYFSLLEHGDQS